MTFIHKAKFLRYSHYDSMQCPPMYLDLPHMSPQKLIRVLLFKLSRYDQHSSQAAVLYSYQLKTTKIH